MAFESRKSAGPYLYLGVRDPVSRKVRKLYVGRGDRAAAAAKALADRKQQREADRRGVHAVRDTLRDADALAAEWDGAVSLLLEAVFLAAGYRRQNYGPWRRQRHGHGGHGPGAAAGRPG